MTDAGEELPSSVELFKMATARRFSPSLNILDKAEWDAAVNCTLDADVPIYIPLILDAEATLPDIGTAITLASTALETLIERHLGRLAAAKCAPPELWSWITKRGFFLKEPSTEEQFDRLLKIFSGKSLKDESHSGRHSRTSVKRGIALFTEATPPLRSPSSPAPPDCQTRPL
jgi:hypothetical protein